MFRKPPFWEQRQVGQDGLRQQAEVVEQLSGLENLAVVGSM